MRTAAPVAFAAHPLHRAAVALVAVAGVVYLAETIAGLMLGLAAGSPALVGLGADSAVKLVAALVVIWELTGQRTIAQQRAALRVLAVLFFTVAAYLVADGVRHLVDDRSPQIEPAQLIAAGLGIAVLAPLIIAKRVLAEHLASATLTSDADKTRLYALLCAAVLIGLTLELTFGWWWADHVAAMVVAGIAIREGAQDWAEARELGGKTQSASTG